MLTADHAVYFAAIIIAGALYWRLWTSEPHLKLWRKRHNEHGEAAWQLVVVAVTLTTAIVVLTLHGDTVPAVLQQGLSGVLVGIGTSELTLRKHERKQGRAVHPKRSTARTPHP